MWCSLKRKKGFELELEENIICKDEILKEFKKIRHEYNNMLQGIVSFIEEEEWEELKKYKDKVMEKTQLLNNNNFTQLVKIKDKSILNLVYKLLMKAKEADITINLTIYNDIYDISSYGIEFCKALNEYLNYAYEVAIKDVEKVNFKISSNEQGLRFVFETTFFIKSDNVISTLSQNKMTLKLCKNIFFNTLIENDCLIQEILVSVI